MKITYNLDPLKTKYDTMPVSSFLKEVQSMADSLSSAAPASAGE